MGASPERSASQRIEVVHLTAYSHDSRLCARTGRPGRGSRRTSGTSPSPRVASSEPPREEREGRRRVGPGPEPVLVRGTGAHGEASLPTHRRPARGRRARASPLPVRKHRDGAARVPDSASVNRGCHPGPERRGRRARALRRQPQWPDHLQGSAPAWDRARPPLASRLPVHARRRRGRRGLRVSRPSRRNASQGGPLRPALIATGPEPSNPTIAALRPATRGARRPSA